MSLAALAFGIAVSDPMPESAQRFLEETFAVTEYEAALADLNNDEVDEIIVRATGRERCGSGGCALFMLTPEGDSYWVMMSASVTHPPIRMLNSATDGWRDLAVTVGGGGIREPYEVRLRFDGTRYPANPTVLPPIGSPVPGGEILISDVIAIPAPR